MIKIDENTIEVTKTVPVAVSKVKFERGYLERQRKAIQMQRDEFCAARDAELAEVDSYLKACDELGIVSKPEAKDYDTL
jgi:hypothetical protein